MTVPSSSPNGSPVSPIEHEDQGLVGGQGRAGIVRERGHQLGHEHPCRRDMAGHGSQEPFSLGTSAAILSGAEARPALRSAMADASASVNASV